MSWQQFRRGLVAAAVAAAGGCVPPDESPKNCLENGSFESPVMPPAWVFVADDGLDGRGLRLVSSTAHLHRVGEGEVPDGAYFLAFRGIGPATLESAPIHYQGGVIEVRGLSAACGLRSLIRVPPGVVELVGRDDSGTVVQVRTILEQPEGDSPWREFSAQTEFSEKVTSMILRLRTMMTACGEFRLDGLVVKIIDRKP